MTTGNERKKSMDKKILFFDIDGTLLNGEAVVPESTVAALKELKEQGHLRFVCTGRTKCMIPEEVNKLAFDGYVLGGGTEVEYEGKQISYYELPVDLIKKTVPVMQKYKVTYLFEGRDNIYYEQSAANEERAYFSGFVKSFGKLAVIIKEYDEIHASKITLVPPEGFTKEIAENFRKDLEQDFNVIIHAPANNDILTDGLIELVPIGINKATGIQDAIRSLGMTKEMTVGIGDSNNDLEMLSYVGTAVCMGNGTSRAKELADLVTTHIDDDGIWNSMKSLQLI